MAVVSPFAAIRFDAAKVGGLDRVVTQPFDKITPEMQRAYFERSPFNLARIVKGEVKPGDSPTENVYTRASGLFREWLEKGVFSKRKAPALYPYFEEFRVPDSQGDQRLVRKGFIGLCKLEEYENGVVYPHEKTHLAAKADRLELLRATRAQFEQIFMLYSDPEGKVDRLLDQSASGAPTAQAKDEYGVTHTLWDMDDPEQIRAVQEAMLDRKLIIADGHHRYETALNFRRECQARHPQMEQSGCMFATVAFVNMDSKGIVVLPTHRLVVGLPEFTGPGFLSRAARYFTGTEYPFSGPAQREDLLRKLRSDMASVTEAGGIAIGALFEDRQAFYRLDLRKDADLERLLPDLSPAQRGLDVTVLHRIAFALCLGLDEALVSKEQFLSYIRDFEEGVRAVDEHKAQACFFLNPVKMQQVCEIAFDRRSLPQKSTDFYPKLLSGLAIYDLET